MFGQLEREGGLEALVPECHFPPRLYGRPHILFRKTQLGADPYTHTHSHTNTHAYSGALGSPGPEEEVLGLALHVEVGVRGGRREFVERAVGTLVVGGYVDLLGGLRRGVVEVGVAVGERGEGFEGAVLAAHVTGPRGGSRPPGPRPRAAPRAALPRGPPRFQQIHPLVSAPLCPSVGKPNLKASVQTEAIETNRNNHFNNLHYLLKHWKGGFSNDVKTIWIGLSYDLPTMILVIHQDQKLS